MPDTDSPPPAPAPRAPQTLHEFSLNDQVLHPLPEAEQLLRDLGRDPVQGALLHGTRILMRPLPHLVGIRAEPPGETLTGREGQLLEGLMVIQQARGGRYTLLGLGMHPVLAVGGGTGNSQCLHIRVSYRTGEEGEELLQKILAILPYLVAVSAASPFVEGRLEPAVDNRLLWLPGTVPPDPGTGSGERAAPDPASLVHRPQAGCLEIRALDGQECIHSDLAMVAFLSALLRHPDPGADRDAGAIASLLGTAIQYGTSRLQPELERLMEAARGSATRDERRFLPVVARRIEQGSLAETLRDRSVSGEPLADLLSDLVFCLKTNLPSGMVG
jgi:glutamate---cysteine ligase / carboxylate-amine ligase